MDGEKQGILVC